MRWPGRTRRVPIEGMEGARPAGDADDGQVAPEDCGLRNLCPRRTAHSKEEVKLQSINLEPKDEHLEVERERYEFFLAIPEVDIALVAPATTKGRRYRPSSSTRSMWGCGETPYLKLLTQLFGDRMLVANAWVLVDLRRQPADDSVVAQRRRARAGVVELALRGQRRVRPRDPARARSASARRALVPVVAPDTRGRHPRGRSSRARPRSRLSAGVWPVSRHGAAARTPRRHRPPRPLECPRQEDRLDRRRRRLGVRHRLRSLDHVLASGRNASICWFSTPRSTRTRVVRRRRRHPAEPVASSPQAASGRARRTSA